MDARTPGESKTDAEAHPVGREQVIQSTLRAAANLFAERNVSQVSVREIAAAAGVSHALVHRYMGSKDDIFRAVLEYDRQTAAEYWRAGESMSDPSSTFDADTPPGRFVRTVMRASLDGIALSPEEVKFPHAGAMLAQVHAHEVPKTDQSAFDPRLIFSALTAMVAAKSVAPDFFLVQSGLEDADPEWLRLEFNRLILRIMGLAENPSK